MNTLLPNVSRARMAISHARTLRQRAVRTVREAVMREELDQFIGAAWGECSRQQQRLS